MRQKRANIWSALPQVLFDIVWVYFSYWIALMLRFDGKVPWWEFEYFQIQIPWATCICLQKDGIFLPSFLRFLCIILVFTFVS